LPPDRRGFRLSSEAMGFELQQRNGAADFATRRLDERGRMVSGLPCPFVDGGLCIIYAVRPLACRGHASYDEKACIDTLAGHPSEVPVSELHVTVGSLVQNAMQAAMRDAGYAWGAYELNQALRHRLDERGLRSGLAQRP
jgi:Fe-S-cluster containining protein